MGVPIHLWDKEVFDKIAEQFGPIVHGSLAAVRDGNLAHDLVAFIREDGWRVVENIEVQWRRESFQVWVMELGTDWDPDFVLLKPEKVAPEIDAQRIIEDKDDVPVSVNHEKEKTNDPHIEEGKFAGNEENHFGDIGDTPEKFAKEVQGVGTWGNEKPLGDQLLGNNNTCMGKKSTGQSPNVGNLVGTNHDGVDSGFPPTHSEIPSDRCPFTKDPKDKENPSARVVETPVDHRSARDTNNSPLKFSQFRVVGQFTAGPVDLNGHNPIVGDFLDSTANQVSKDSPRNKSNIIPDLNVDISQKGKSKWRHKITRRKRLTALRRKSKVIVSEDEVDINDEVNNFIRDGHVDRFWEDSSFDGEWTEGSVLVEDSRQNSLVTQPQ
ncbi:hypothetical protein Hanom_Chr01g00036421 [Helianthus anomalus]